MVNYICDCCKKMDLSAEWDNDFGVLSYAINVCESCRTKIRRFLEDLMLS